MRVSDHFNGGINSGRLLIADLMEIGGKARNWCFNVKIFEFLFVLLGKLHWKETYSGHSHGKKNVRFLLVITIQLFAFRASWCESVSVDKKLKLSLLVFVADNGENPKSNKNKKIRAILWGTVNIKVRHHENYEKLLHRQGSY